MRNILLILTLLLSVLSDAQNLVDNQGFESGNEGGWWLGGNQGTLESAEAEHVFNGNNSVKIINPSVGASYAVNYFQIKEYTDLVPGDQYKLSVYVKTLDASGRKQFKFNFKYALNSGSGYKYDQSDLITLSEAYTKYVHVFTVPDDFKSLQFGLYFGQNMGTFYVDDAVFEKLNVGDVVENPIDTASKTVSFTLNFNESHLLQKDAYGVNSNLFFSPFYSSNSGFINTYEQAGKPTYRYPGGTTGNYANLYTGKQEAWPNANAKDSARLASVNDAYQGRPDGYDFTQFGHFLNKTKASATFIVNITCMTMEETRFVLDSLHKMGAVIDYFEIGNELYYGQYATPIPNVYSYIAKSRAVIAVIDEIYPDAKVGLIIPSHIFTSESFLDGPVNDANRQEVWYNEISKISNETFFDAVVIHMYADIGMPYNVTEDNFIPYTQAYKYCISHVDKKFKSTIDRIKQDFPGKDIFSTEYHVGGFSSSLNKYRLRYSYLGAFFTARYMLKMFQHEEIKISSWHSFAKMLKFNRTPYQQLPDNYKFDTEVNYTLMTQFKDPVLNSNTYSAVSIENAGTYQGLGNKGSGIHSDMEAGNFYNSNTNTGYVMLFNKLDSTYYFNEEEFETLNKAFITEVVETAPNKLATLNQALQDEKSASVSQINPDNNGNYKLNPYSFYRIKYAFNVMDIDSITLNKDSLNFLITKHENETLSASIHPDTATFTAISWKSSDENVATVNQQGMVTAVAEGSAQIRVEFKGDRAIFTSCEVEVLDTITRLSMDTESVTLGLSTTDSLHTVVATLLPPSLSLNSLNWISLDPSVATVENGVITATGVGETYVKVTYSEDATLSDSCKVTVTNPIKVTLDETSIKINLRYDDAFYQLNGGVSPFNANVKKIKWSSSADTVTTVDQNGLLTALSEGEAIIKAEHAIYSNLFKECKVVVQNPISGITLNTDTLRLILGKQEKDTLIATVIPENATNKTVNWGALNSSIVHVTNTGIVTAKHAGKTAVLIVYSKDQSIIARCVVIVEDATGISDNKIEGIRAYPNPVHDVFTINGLLCDCEYSILDLNGESMLSGTTSDYTIDISTLSNGNYIVILRDGHAQNKILIVKH